MDKNTQRLMGLLVATAGLTGLLGITFSYNVLNARANEQPIVKEVYNFMVEGNPGSVRKLDFANKQDEYLGYIEDRIVISDGLILTDGDKVIYISKYKWEVLDRKDAKEHFNK